MFRTDKDQRTRKRVSPKWSAILVWLLAFIGAETFGSVFVSSIVIKWGINTIEAYSLSQAGTVAFRTIVLIILSAVSVLGLKEAIYRPAPKKSRTFAIVLIGIGIILVSNVLIGIQTSGIYKASILGTFYFLNNGGISALIFGLPIQTIYYFSEVVVMNYMYILAKKGWTWSKGPLTSGTIFLILGWALLHAITKDVFVSIDGIILVLIFYFAYEYSEKTPIAPIILWFVQLIS